MRFPDYIKTHMEATLSSPVAGCEFCAYIAMQTARERSAREIAAMPFFSIIFITEVL